MRPEDVQQTIEHVHQQFVDELDGLVNIHLPDPVDRRLRAYFDGLNARGEFDSGVPDWAMSLYHAQEALMSAYYHRSNLEQVERRAMDILEASVGGREFEVARSHMSLGARVLAAEYHAYLVAVRRIFDYAARAVALRFTAQPAKLNGLGKAVKDEPTPEVYQRTDALVTRTYAELKDLFDDRNLLAHEEPIPAGQFELVFARDIPCQIAFVRLGENFDQGHALALNGELFAHGLDAQLHQAEDLLHDFAELAATAPSSRPA